MDDSTFFPSAGGDPKTTATIQVCSILSRIAFVTAGYANTLFFSHKKYTSLIAYFPVQGQLKRMIGKNFTREILMKK